MEEVERGQVIPLIVLIIVFAGVLIVGLGRLGADAVDRAQAQSAADLAALAGAADGREAAAEVAHANGARLIGWEAADADVRVRVERRGFEATARARRGSVARGTAGDSTLRVGDDHG